MSLKDENTRYLIVCVACSIPLIVVFAVFQQLTLLYYLTFTYWLIIVLYWGIPLIRTGMKEVREARGRGEEASWKKNPRIKEVLIVIIPALFMVVQFLAEARHLPQKTSIPVVDTIITIFLSILFVPMIMFEVAFTIGLVRRFHHLNDPYKEFLEGLVEGGSQEE